MKNIPQYLMYALLALGSVFALMSVFGGNHDPLLGYMKLLTVVCAVIAIVSFFYDMVVNPDTIMSTLILVGGLAITFGLGYVMASDEVLESYPEAITASVSKMSGAGLYMFYIIGAIAVGSILVTSVMNALKKL